MATALMEKTSSVPEEAAIPRKLWTRTEYRQLIAEGFLLDGKVELVNGEIWEKMGQGSRHIVVVTWLIAVLGPVFGLKRLRTQASFPMSAHGEPEPDVAVMAQELNHYLEEDPIPADVLLVVEASDSTLRPDLTAKARQYGSVGIREYWVVDIPNRLLHVFRQPTQTGYANETILTPEQEVRPLAAPESAIRVADLLP